MCGVVAIINKQKQDLEIGKLLETIRHRGPDDSGWLEWNDGRLCRGQDAAVLTGEVILGHARLSIIDLSKAGWQPMSSADGCYHVVFNGEVYNYLELRNELEKCGYIFKTHTDTEVLLTALVEWKEAALTKLRGMFAFCFFDVERREMLLARDYFGIKPLYFCETSQFVAFASEQKTLLSLSGVSNKTNAQSLYEYLLVGVTDQGVESMFQDIRQVPAGHYMRVSIDDAKLSMPVCYWSVDLSRKIKPTFRDAVDRVRELFFGKCCIALA